MSLFTGRMKTAGNQICYWVRRGSDRGVVFLHGLGCSKESFAAAFGHGAFPDELTLVAPDLLGHGASSRTHDNSYSLESHGTCVSDLVRECKLAELYVVGHSMGGAIGLVCSAELPKILGFFSLEGNLVAEDCTLARRVASVTERHFVDRLYPMAPLRFRCRGLREEPPADPLAFYRSALSLLAWSESGDLLRTLQKLQARKTYFYGGENEDMPVLRRLQGIELVRIDDCGHFMMIDRPDDTYAQIVKRL